MDESRTMEVEVEVEVEPMIEDNELNDWNEKKKKVELIIGG